MEKRKMERKREGKGKESFNWDVDSGGVLRE